MLIIIKHFLQIWSTLPEALRQKQNLISLLKIFFHEEPDPEKLAYHRFHYENFNHDLFLELYNTDYNYFHFLLTKKEIFIPNSLTYDTITLLEENFKDNECEAVVDEFYRWFWCELLLYEIVCGFSVISCKKYVYSLNKCQNNICFLEIFSSKIKKNHT